MPKTKIFILNSERVIYILKANYFESMPASKAVIFNAIPALVSELMLLVYNLADTFFIAQTNDPYQVAAVSIATPIFLLMLSMSIIFCVGGMSCVSRSLGAKEIQRAKNFCSCAIWSSVLAGLILPVILLLFINKILFFIGASKETFDFTRDYLSIVSLTGPFFMFSICSTGVMRAEGQARRAMTGQVLGNLTNIILDPIMILYLGWGIKGAAIATVIGSIAGNLYYASYFLSGKSDLGINIKNFKFKDGIAKGIFAIGIPACLDPVLMSVSQIVLNSLMVAYGDMAVAASGVAMKINQMATLAAMSSGQGVQPLLGFCVGAKNWKRYDELFSFAMKFTVIMVLSVAGLCFIFSKDIVGLFLSNLEAFDYAVTFNRILLTSAVAFGAFFIIINALQAMGAAKTSLILSLCRQCVIYVPAMYILNIFWGAYGLVWALPVTEVLSLIQTIFLYNNEIKILKN